MKKPNCILAILAAFIFACSAFPAAIDNHFSLYKDLMAKQQEFGGSVKDYYKSVPKEEWLPIWEEILSIDDLTYSVYAWMDFAGGPLRFIYENEDGKKTRARLRSKFEEQCALSNHFTISEFSDKLFEWFGHELNFKGFKKASEDRDHAKHNFYDVCDVLKLLGLQEKLNEITLKLAEELRWGDYREFPSTTVIEPTLGDLSTYNYSSFPKKNSKLEDWKLLRDISLPHSYNTYAAFMKVLKETAVFHNDCFFIIKFYCECLHDDELAKEFLQSNFSLEKVCTLTEGFPEYIELCKKLDVPLDTRYRTSAKFQFIQWQLFYNASAFCNNAEWFWEEINESGHSHTKDILVKPMLQNYGCQEASLVLRYFMISEPDEFIYYLRKNIKKGNYDICALFLAIFTDDLEEYEKCITILCENHRYVNKVGISCLILNLNEDHPASCARPLLEMIKRSDLLSNPDSPFYGERFKKWCLAKSETEVAAEMDALLKEAKPKEMTSISEYEIDLKGLLECGWIGSDFSPERHYENHPQREWLPGWKKRLSSDDLSDAVTNWLVFAKYPLKRLRDKGGFIKSDLKGRLIANCEKEGHYSFEDFTSALVNAKINEDLFERESWAHFCSSSQGIAEILGSITFYNLADTLVFLDLTNELPKVAERALKTIDFSELDVHELSDYEHTIFADSRWIPSWIRDCPFGYHLNDVLEFVKEYKQEETFLRYAEEELKEHPNALPLLNKYCIVLADQKRAEEAKAFINEYFPPEKIYHNPYDHNQYFEALRKAGVSFSVAEFIKEFTRIQFEENREILLRSHWLWSGSDREEQKVARAMLQPLLASLSEQTFLTLKRLSQVSETNWFNTFVKEHWEKQKTLPFAVEMAFITDDPKEYAELISFIAKKGSPMVGDLALMIMKLNDETPASCAEDMLALIQKSHVLSEERNQKYSNHFIAWCEKKGKKEVADKLRSFWQETLQR
ncbi:hypothetical protein J6U78_07150 [bacterium]|nr:hypothetical protein [bacterium]